MTPWRGVVTELVHLAVLMSLTTMEPSTSWATPLEITSAP